MAYNKPSDVDSYNEPTLGLFTEEAITIDNSKVKMPSGIKEEEIPSINSTYNTRTITMANQRMRTISTEIDPKMLEETDKPSSEILSEDPVSDPKRGMTAFNTIISMEEEPSINISTKDNITEVKEEINTSTIEPEEEEDFEVFPQEETKVEESISSVTVEEVQVKEEKAETVIKPTSAPIKKASVIAKPVQVEDDFLDLNISTIGKEEVKEAEINLEDIFTPFDPTTPHTQTTEQEMTEIVVPNISDEEFEDLITKINAIENSNNREAQRNVGLKLRNPKSYEARAYRSFGFKTDRQNLEQETLEEATKDTHKLVNSITIDGTTYKDPKTSRSSLSKLENGAIIAEKDSFPMMMALIGGLRKVHLYNSGFWVVVRPPLTSELHTYYTRCNQESLAYGRIFGQLSYLPADIEISRAGFELFKSCIVNSNLDNWNVDDVLERNISSDDENTCLWALASLMYPEGAEIEYVCSNDKCHHIDRVTVDLAKIRYFDFSKLGAEALKFCHSTERRSDSDISNYKENILKSHQSYEISNEWSVMVGSPSMQDMLTSKSNFVDDMTITLNLDDFENIDSFVKARYFKILSAWVSQVQYTNPSDGKKTYFNYALDKVVDALQLRYNNLPEIVINHMKKSKISYFCYSYNACPSCGSIPPSEIEGLIPCDVQQSFFTLTTELLK